MKTLIFILIMGFASVALGSPFLACDVPTDGITPTASEINVNGVVQPGVVILSADGTYYKLLDLSGFAKGTYTFIVRWRDDLMWWSDWSDPFGAGKPAKSGSVRIINE